MQNPKFNKKFIFGFLLSFFTAINMQLYAQSNVDIWELMNRRDLRLTEIDAIANRHFNAVGRVRGTGYKQYERWKFEMQFHLDKNGFILPEDYDQKQYKLTQSQNESQPAQPGAWTELGPFSWSRTSSWNPGVGRITSISVFPLNTNIIYVTSPGGGVWKSINGGNQWTPLNDYNNAMMNLFSVSVDPTNDAIVFTGSNGGILYRSMDGGNTWTTQNSGMGNIRKILFNPTNSQIIFAVGGNGIYRSTNGGSSWTRVLAASFEDIEFQPGNTNNLYASGSNIYRSTDAGVNWTQLTAANGITNSARTLIAVSAADPQIVYAVQSNGGSEFGRLYRSVDGGNNFVTAITGSATTCTNFFGYSTNGCETGGQASYDMAMTVNPSNANEVHIAGIICWKSTNGGNSFVAETAWSLPNSIGYNHADVHVLEWVGSAIYSGSDGGIYKSTDNGDNWTDLSNGLGVRQFYRIANSKTNQVLVTGGAQDNGSSILKSTGWIDWLGADGMDCVVSPLNADYIWGTSQYGSLYRTTNGGISRSDITEPATGNWITPLAIESNSNIIYAGWNDVYKSTDLGVSWTNLSGTTISSNLEELAVAPSNPLYIYASTGSNLYITKNGGTSWNTYTTSGFSITSIAIHPTNPEKIWVSSSNTTNRVLVSTDAGATFTNISGNLPGIAARSIVVDQTSDEGLYVGMNIGVFYTNKNLSGWIDLSDNLPLVSVNEVELQISGGKLRVGTYGRGLWERSVYSSVSCSTPTSLNASNVTVNSASVSWVINPDADNYDVDYKAASSGTWINAISGTASSSANLSGLSGNTLYDWRVRSNCTGGSSSYSQAQFTTLTPPTCGTVSGLTSSSITNSSATLSWSALSGANNYDVDYKLFSSSTWINAATAVISTSVNLGGLSSATLYDWRVRANCTGASGPYSQAQFTTAGTTCPDILETNNTIATAKAISTGTEYTALIATSTDKDYYSFSNTSALKRIKITLTNLPANYNMNLYKPNNSLAASSSNSGITSETIIYNATKTSQVGNYKVYVYGNNGEFNPTQCYTLLVQLSATNFTAANPPGEEITSKAYQETEIIRQGGLRLYPVPASGTVTVSFDANDKGKADIMIINQLGAVVLRKQANTGKGINYNILDIRNLANGMYFVKVNQDNEVKTQKLIIQR